MELRKSTFAFYAGVMVGVVGNLLVSCLIEMAKAIFEDSMLIVLTSWAIMFIISSTIFFQLVKFAMKRLETPERVLWLFDFATGFSTICGIIVIVYGMIR
ncbi:MAG: hypothetical protein ACE5I5_17585 [Candidatus Heimdallarchaeota archaeon]